MTYTMTPAFWQALMRRAHPDKHPAILRFPGQLEHGPTMDSVTPETLQEACLLRDSLSNGLRYLGGSEVNSIQRNLASALKAELAQAMDSVLRKYGLPVTNNLHVQVSLRIPPQMRHTASIEDHNDFLIDFNGSAVEWAKANNEALLKPHEIQVTVMFPTVLMNGEGSVDEAE